MSTFTYDTQNTSEILVGGFFPSNDGCLVDPNGKCLRLRFDNSNGLLSYRPSIDHLLNLGLDSKDMTVVSHRITPTKYWHPARKEVLEKYGGILSNKFSGLAKLGDEIIDKIVGSESVLED